MVASSKCVSKGSLFTLEGIDTSQLAVLVIQGPQMPLLSRLSMLWGRSSAHIHVDLPAPCLNHSAWRKLAAPPPPDSTTMTSGARLKTPARYAPFPHPEHPDTITLVGSCPLPGFASSTSITRSIIHPLAMLGFTSDVKP